MPTSSPSHPVVSMLLSPWSILVVLLLAGCVARTDKPTLFVQRSPEETGVHFTNNLSEDPAFNIIEYLNYYNGAGVAAGDVNGDGRVDLYFTANEGPNRLYLNQGGFRFEDVTEQAGVSGAGNWTTGVTMADVDADGQLDIYVSGVGGYRDRTGRNQLFVNNGDGTFTDRTEEYGLGFVGYGSHAAFFDYDRDGDLDVYLVNHSTHGEGTFGEVSLRDTPHERAGDRLLRNDTDPSSSDGVCFTDVTESAGIYHGVIGYGLSVTVRDFDVDGWPDVYVANDFHEDDYLYYNNGDGTFTEQIRVSMGHTSYSSMGSDAADYNNDGLTDLVVVDMLPEREVIAKTSTPPDDQTLYALKRELGYHHQLPWNTLQLGQGGRRFSEVAPLAGVHATDWSWSPLFADVDLDGFLDLFVTNGIYRRPNDLDFVAYIGGDAVQAAIRDGMSRAEADAAYARMPSVPIANYAFRNEGGLSFTNQAAAWGLDAPGFSTGSVYADLDDDGDLDLVVSEINAPASIYENRADTLTANHYLTVHLSGDGGNPGGTGARVTAFAGGSQITREAQPVRGWLSSTDPRLHFGLGASEQVDSLLVVWPDGRYQVQTDVEVDQMLTVRQEAASGSYAYGGSPSRPLFTDVTSEIGIPYAHEENDFVDFNRELLMPHRLSMEGPALAVADVNGDGLDDLFAGGAKWQAAVLMVQQPDGGFMASNEALWAADSLHEDVDAAFFDADSDGDADLYVVSGGNEFWGRAEALRDRLYLNDGRGGFTRTSGLLPDHFANGSRVRPADFDLDGDLDLFVGSRVVSRAYGMTPTSVLLQNDGGGTFHDVTASHTDGLEEAGMVTDAAWGDYNGDGLPDLAVVGEWMPIRLYVQEDGRLVERTHAAGLDASSGWWTSVAAVDLEGDGDVDLVGGNAGLNVRFRPRSGAPLYLYVKDFDNDNRPDPIVTYSRDGEAYPIATTDQLFAQLAPLRERYPTYTAFGARTLDGLFTERQLEGAVVREARTFATSVAENVDGSFRLRPLAEQAQISPVYRILVDDFDGDEVKDVMLAGNFTGAEPTFGRYDAGFGWILRGGTADSTGLSPEQSGLWLDGDVRRIEWLGLADGRRVLAVARNDRPLQFIYPSAVGDSSLQAGR